MCAKHGGHSGSLMSRRKSASTSSTTAPDNINRSCSVSLCRRSECRPRELHEHPIESRVRQVAHFVRRQRLDRVRDDDRLVAHCAERFGLRSRRLSP